MKKDIDNLDIEILKYLEDDARRSLKKLADKLKKKTSTIYHRLQRLKSNNIILGYSTVINPEYLDIEKISLIKIKIKPLNINSLDDMFIKSFGNYLNNEFDNVLFIALSESNRIINIISVHMSEMEHHDFIEQLKSNPYIEDIESDFLSQIMKGQKLFNFNEDWIKNRKQDSDNEEEEDEDELDERTMEITIDDDGDDELKF